MTLRRAEAGDAAAVRELTRQAYAKWVPVIGREPKPMQADYDEAVRNHRIDLLHVDGKLAALIETIDEPDHLLVENVAVAPGLPEARAWPQVDGTRRAIGGVAGLSREFGSIPTSSSPRTWNSMPDSAIGSTVRRPSPPVPWSI